MDEREVGSSPGTGYPLVLRGPGGSIHCHCPADCPGSVQEEPGHLEKLRGDAGEVPGKKQSVCRKGCWRITTGQERQGRHLPENEVERAAVQQERPDERKAGLSDLGLNLYLAFVANLP